MAATKAARSATSVLPKPTSPHTRRSIGRPDDRSPSTASMLASWSSVSSYGKRATNSSYAPSGARHRRRLLQLAQRGDLDQLGGDLAQPLLELGLARLPGDAAELVELRVGFIGAVARQQLDVLDRQEQLVAACIVQLEAVVRRAEHGDGLKAEKAADAVVGVHDEIADRKARRLGQHVDGAALLAPRAHEAIAEDVLLADDGDLRRLEALLEAEHADGRGRAGQRQRLGVGFDARHVLEAVVGRAASPGARARRASRR